MSFDTAANIPIFCQNCRYPNHEHYCLEHIFNIQPIIQTIVIVQKSEVIGNMYMKLARNILNSENFKNTGL